jgi:pyruvate-formate lyase-activating enzyme
MSRDRILFVTAYIDDQLYDYVGQYSPQSRYRDGFPRDIAYGLRFIKQNIPSIEILEYPSPEEYKEVLKRGWDVVGFSFYMNETERVLRMIEWAREAGVQEIWGGNYGVVNKYIESQFDRRFIGYAEGQLQKALGLPETEIIHPPLPMRVAWPAPGKNYLTSYPVGVLFTTRGCSFKCTFCQSPAFAPRPVAIPFENINRVLEFYKSEGIREIFLLDENFGNIPKQADKVIQRMGELGLNWTPMTRGDLLNRNFDSWTRNGLSGALMGVESMNQEVLNEIKKKSAIENMTNLVSRMNNQNLLTIGFYIIGFETDTAESVRRDLKAVAELQLDLTQVCILTPLPGTPLWDEIDSKYGIFEKDYEKYDAGHLVWNHPHLSPAEAREIVDWSLDFLQSPRTFFRRFVKWQLHRVEKDGRLMAPFLLNRSFVKANINGLRRMNARQPVVMFPNDQIASAAPSPVSLSIQRALKVIGA